MITKEEAEKLYTDLIQLRRSEVLKKSNNNLGLIERHHIIPKSCGGIDDESNLIALYAKEHFMAHVYLWVIHHDDEFHDQMTCALMNMIKGTKCGLRSEIREFILASEEYQQAKKEFAEYFSKLSSELNSGEKNSMYGKHWYHDPITNECKPFVEGEQPDGWIRGIDPVRSKLLTKILPHNNATGKIQIYNSVTDTLKFIFPDEPLLNGFKIGGRPLPESGKQKLRDFYKKNCEENIAPKRIAELRPQYEYYLKYGWDKFKNEFNYKYTQSNFIGLCKRYLSEYKSRKQN